MRQSGVLFLALLLVVVGLSTAYYKVDTLGYPLVQNKTYNVWYLEAQFDIDSLKMRYSKDNPAEFQVYMPVGGANYAITDEHIVQQDFGGGEPELMPDQNRLAIFTKRKINKNEVLLYRAMVHELDSPANNDAPPPGKINSPHAEKNRPHLEEGQEQSGFYLAMDSLLKDAEDKSSGEQSFVRELVELLSNPRDERVLLLRQTLGQDASVPEMAATLLEVRNIPSRVVNGVQLGEEVRSAKLLTWLEVYLQDKWRPIDPLTGRFGMKNKYLAWWYGTSDMHSFRGEVSRSSVDAQISIRQNTDNSLTRAIWRSEQDANVLMKFSFFDLPISTQMIFKVLLLVPVGALVIAFLRQIIGIKTIGTFMPVLIALAFRETGLQAGIVLFTMVVAFGLLVRAFFDKLQLLMVPRLTAMLTVVVITLGLLVMATHHLGYNAGLSISLFPIVILTMAIERMSIMWEEEGARSAMMAGTTSLLCAVLCFVVMNQEQVAHLVFTFPELLLVVLAAALLIGRYNGYKLSEYTRFRFLRNAIEQQYQLGTQTPASVSGDTNSADEKEKR